jgi:uncharacterized membrane protein
MNEKPVTYKLATLKNRKVILGVLALLMCLVVIFLFSFIPYTISADRLKAPDFITDLLIVCAIVILAMISAIFIGQASNAQNPKSKLAKSTVSFIDSKNNVVSAGVFKFKKWIQKVQQPNDIVTIKERILSEAGIEDFTILNLNEAEIKTLIEGPQIIANVPYPSITKAQAEVILHIKHKGIKVMLVPPEYYLNVKNLLDNRTSTERAANEGKKKSLTLISSITSKLVVTILFSVIFALFVRDMSNPDADTASAVAKLFSRLWSFFTSVFMGYLVGCQINDIDAEYIDMRIGVHTEFLEDTTFNVGTIKEEAKKEFIEEQKKVQLLDINRIENSH